MSDSFFNDTRLGDHELYGGFEQAHDDLLSHMIQSCRHWQNTFAMHLQFHCDALRGCRCKSFFNRSMWTETYDPFIKDMHRWSDSIMAHLRDRRCLVENSEAFGEFRYRYHRLATQILEWQGRHAESQERHLSETLCTPCYETANRIHHQALEYLYFDRQPTLDIR